MLRPIHVDDVQNNRPCFIQNKWTAHTHKYGRAEDERDMIEKSQKMWEREKKRIPAVLGKAATCWKIFVIFC